MVQSLLMSEFETHPHRHCTDWAIVVAGKALVILILAEFFLEWEMFQTELEKKSEDTFYVQ